ncbi:hypothetical protein Tco_1043439 [Tanacetum coccineum]|uniref:Uncharacterized protein n=1 Tax=Tanacetum coccineum TaxID=301880 RepID=A0ABQ5GND0_9ASTR
MMRGMSESERVGDGAGMRELRRSGSRGERGACETRCRRRSGSGVEVLSKELRGSENEFLDVVGDCE